MTETPFEAQERDKFESWARTHAPLLKLQRDICGYQSGITLTTSNAWMHRAHQACRAEAIADEAMFELLLAHGVLGGAGVDATEIGFTGDACTEVKTLAEASQACRDAFDWLKERGYVELGSDSDGDYVSVLRRPGEDM